MKRILLKISRDFEKYIFFLYFLAIDISLNNLFYSMKLHRHGVKVIIELNVSQILFIGPSFCLMKFRIKSFENVIKVSRFSR